MSTDICYVCLKWGSKYSAEYVNKLAAMMQKWGIPGTPFYCYTDDPAGLDVGVIPVSIPDVDYETWWFKLPLLVDPTINRHHTKVLFDLDVIIHNDVSDIHTHASSNLTVCQSYWKSPAILKDVSERNTLYNSSVMIWHDASYIYDHFYTDPERFMSVYKGVDRFLWHEDLDVDVLPHNIVYSYRRGATLQDTRPFTKRDNYSIALFHGTPKQTDLPNDPLVKEYWNEL